MELVHRVLGVVRLILRGTTFPDEGASSRFERFSYWALRSTVQVTRETFRSGLFNLGNALAFQSIFSTIPVIVIGLTILTQFISQQEVAEIADYLSLHMLPAQAQRLAPEVRRIADAVDVSTLGIVGVLGLVAVAATLFWTLTHTVDEIWGVRQKPPLAFRALSAVVILLLLPTFAGLSLFVTHLFDHLPWSADFFLPVAVNIVGLYLAYRYVPSTAVDGRAAVFSALLMGLVFEVAKVVFSFYVTRLSVTLRGLYGAIAFIPMSFFWIWVLWIIFLFGVTLTYTLQNLPELWLRDARRRPGAVGASANAPLALLVVLQIYEKSGAMTLAIARELEASPVAVRDVVDRLVDASMVLVGDRGAVLPTRAPSEVAIADVLALFETVRDVSDDDALAVDDLLEQLLEARLTALDEATLADLID